MAREKGRAGRRRSQREEKRRENNFCLRLFAKRDKGERRRESKREERAGLGLRERQGV